MRIKNMKLEYFQGLKSFEMNPEGKDVDIYGQNGTGKTTVSNAYNWVLFNKPGTDEKNYSPETVESNGITHSAEIVFYDDSGKGIKLKKTLRKSGKSSKTEYQINDEKIKQKEYDRFLEDICKPDIMRMLARDDVFLSDVSKEERRKIVIDVAGDVEDSDVIKSDEKLKNLPEILGGKTPESYKKIAKDKIKELKKESGRLKILIDAGNRELREPEKTKEFMEGVLTKLKERKKELEEKKAATPDEQRAEIRKKISDLEAKKAKAETMHESSLRDAEMDEIIKIRQISEQIEICNRGIFNKQLDRDSFSIKIEKAKKERENLIKKWKEVNERQFEEAETCPCCGQKMPQDKIEDARKAFNVKKSNDLEEITKAGKEVSKEVIEGMEKELNQIESDIKELKNKISEFEKEISDLKNKPKPLPFQETDICKNFDEKIQSLKESLNAEAQQEDNSIVQEIEAVENDIEKNMRLLLDIESHEKKKAELEEMEKKRLQAVAECESYEFGLHLCKIFSLKKSEMLDEQVNSMFENVHFRLFKELVNGEVEEDCEPLVKCREGWIPYRKANHASKVKAGLEVVQGLSNFYKIDMPVFIDNAESIVTDFPETSYQQIRLHAKKGEEELRCEYDG